MQASVARRMGRPAWANARTILGLLLFVISLAGGRAVMTSADTRSTLWVPDRDLASGSRLSSSDLVPVKVNLPTEQAGLYLSSAEVDGLVLQRPLREGELVPVDALASSGTSTRVVTIPIEPEHAAGGRLSPGDIVDVWATFGTTRTPSTKLIVGAVEVVGLVTEGGLVGDEALSGVSVAIPPEAAARVVLALRSGEIDILASDGTPSAEALTSIEVGDL